MSHGKKILNPKKSSLKKKTSHVDMVNNQHQQARGRCTSFTTMAAAAITHSHASYHPQSTQRIRSNPGTNEAVYSKSHAKMSDDELDKRHSTFYADTTVHPDESWPEPDDLAPPPEEWLPTISSSSSRDSDDSDHSNKSSDVSNDSVRRFIHRWGLY